ncbi:MAG: ABC transporter substrate-binding protein [Deltaproteobacteria bacterium]|nr:ABC transporter substrate-binding protein [Deltaproteobacteria bacterium]
MGWTRRRSASWSRLVIPLALTMLIMDVSMGNAQRRYPIRDCIVLGMSTALSGPAAKLGLNMAEGVKAAIEEFNRSGGIHGRNLRLIVLDDGYEPVRTVPNMRRLVEKERVLAVVGNVGTPTAVVAIPIANASRTPFVGAFTGAGILRRKPPDRYVINYRASYNEEVTAMVNALMEFARLKPEQIAFFTQRDAYGDAGFAAGIRALKDHGLHDEHLIVHGRYERNTVAVENALAEIIMAEPQPRAVIMVGAYAPCAAFIMLARNNALNALFLNVSFAGAEPLAKALGPAGDGVIVTEVVPHYDENLPIAGEYKKALKALNLSGGPSCASLEGYIAMRMLGLALTSIKGRLTREAVVDALEALGEFDLGLGVPLRLGPSQHQACHVVWPTMLKSGKVVPFEWKTLAVLGKGKRHD